MTRPNECLQTHAPKVLNFPDDMSHPESSVSWALSMFANNIVEADMQYRDNSTITEKSSLLYFDQEDSASFEKFRQRIVDGKPVHGSLPLIDFCAGDGTVRDNASWAWQIYDTHFHNRLTQCHRFGSYVRSTLWMSCGEHVYDAHCDPFDGFLFHMAGRKRVTVWPLPEKHTHDVIFNHADFEGRMASKPMVFDLEPGQILFIPTGAMHEVVSLGEEASVSVSFHMGSPFPMHILCMQLNKMLQGGDVSLPDHMTSINKFKMYFFEPTRFIDHNTEAEGTMPNELSNALKDVLGTNNVHPSTMDTLLGSWWQIAVTHQLYQGPYPERLAEYVE